MEFKTKLETFCKRFGMNVESTDFDDDQEVYVIDNAYYFGRNKSTNTYFLQAIVTYPGTYWEAPTEDQKDIVPESSNFSFVAMELIKAAADETLNGIGEAEMFDKIEGGGLI